MEFSLRDARRPFLTANAAMWEVFKTLLEAAAIVMLVIYLFLGSLRVVMIPLLTIPLSLIGMCFFGVLFVHSFLDLKHALPKYSLLLRAVAGIDQMGMTIDQARRHDQPAGLNGLIDRASGVLRHVESDNQAVSDQQVGGPVDVVGRVDDAAAADQQGRHGAGSGVGNGLGAGRSAL